MDEDCLAVGMLIVYGNYGICRIEKKEKMAPASGMPSKMYYFLRQERQQNSVLYVPADNEQLLAKIRPILTKAEIDSMIGSMRSQKQEWIENKNMRSDFFRTIYKNGISPELLGMMDTLYRHKNLLTQSGKKLAIHDEQILQNARKMIEEEFSYVLQIQPEEIEGYILQNRS